MALGGDIDFIQRICWKANRLTAEIQTSWSDWYCRGCVDASLGVSGVVHDEQKNRNKPRGRTGAGGLQRVFPHQATNQWQ